MSSNEKKLNIKRILLFILLAYIPNYFLEIVFSDKHGGLTSLFAGETIMYYPAIAAIIVRFATKDDEKHFLKANLKNNKGKYIFAAVFPMTGALLVGLLCSLIFDGDLHAEIFDEPQNTPTIWVSTFFFMLLSVIPQIVRGFGEEYGWRAYLTPKLEKVMKPSLAPAVTGIIWAVWHAPLIWYGYDFGRDYPGFPYLGIVFMCLGCIPMSYVLTWLTKKTNSIYPAAVAHMVLDCTNGILAGSFISADSMVRYSLPIGLILLGLPSVIGLICIGIYTLTKKNASEAGTA